MLGNVVQQCSSACWEGGRVGILPVHHGSCSPLGNGAAVGVALGLWGMTPLHIPPSLLAVERRRRDKINNWIVQLSKIIPDCNADNSKTGASKGGILSKACDYVRELRQSNQRLQETFKEAERLQMDNDLLRQQVEELQSENAVLRAQLQQRGLEGGGPEGMPQ
uniref:Upstream transcription factor 2, c-fos interacting n=1 Tax=Pavo cristatus TaxID=9049 RepID=A0A8C9FG43_PAVCR